MPAFFRVYSVFIKGILCNMIIKPIGTVSLLVGLFLAVTTADRGVFVQVLDNAKDAVCQTRTCNESETNAGLTNLERKMDLILEMFNRSRQEPEVCRRVPDGKTACADGWIPYNGSCYNISVDPMNFSQAKIYCGQLGAYMVRFETAEEDMFFRKYAVFGVEQVLWIGMLYDPSSRQWKYVDDNTVVTYCAWGSCKSSEFGNGGEYCAVVNTPKSWADRRCYNRYNVVCEQRE